MTKSYSTIIPKNYARIVRVGSLSELFDAAANAGPDVNAVLLRRRLKGDFDGLARAMWMYRGNLRLDAGNVASRLRLAMAQPFLSASVREAARIINEDMKAFRPHLHHIEFRKIPARGYENDQKVHAYHHDGGGWRFMTCYNAPVTEWLRPEDAVQDPRNELYSRKHGAPAFRFRPGDIWLHSCSGRWSSPPLVHRAVETGPGDAPRLLAVGTPRFVS